MTTVLPITDETFDTEVLQSDRPTLVQFWAEWCAPCRRVSPIIDQLAADHPDRMKFTRLNIDENQAIAARFAITSIPAMKIFHNGVEVQSHVGAAPQRVFETAFAEYL